MPFRSPTAPRHRVRRRLLAALSSGALATLGAVSLTGAASASVPHPPRHGSHHAARSSGMRTMPAPHTARPRPAARPDGVTSRAVSPAMLAAADAAHARAVQQAAGMAATASWCGLHGSGVGAWTGTVPNLPICGPGPGYGGTLAYVDLPGPSGSLVRYFNATPGFQCVELAERWLAVGEHLAPVKANGDAVAAAYHAAYPHSLLVRDGSPASIGHAPQPGDVISFSLAPDFVDPTDGHVAVVVSSHVNSAGNGTVEIAQQNVSSADYRMVLELVRWRLLDPREPADAALQYPYAEWFHLLPTTAQLVALRHRAPRELAAARAAASAATQLLRSATTSVGSLGRASRTVLVALRIGLHPRTTTSSPAAALPSSPSAVR